MPHLTQQQRLTTVRWPRAGLAAAVLCLLPLAARAVRECEDPAHSPATGACARLPSAELYHTDTGPVAGGRGETIVLLHASSGNADSFQHNLQALHAAGYRVVSYDRKNWGRSSNTERDDALGRPHGTAVQDLDQLADLLKLARFHLVGVAAGGQVAMQYAASRPQRVHSLVLAATLGPQGLAAHEPTLAALQQAIRLPFEIFCPGAVANPPPAPLRLVTPSSASTVNVPQQLAEHRELGSTYRATNPAGVAQFRAVNAQARHASFDGCRSKPIGANQATVVSDDPQALNSFARISALLLARTLLIAGTGDVFYSPPVQMKHWGAAIRDVQYTQLDTGHAPQLEDPSGFNAAVLRFLAGAQPFERLPARP